uniref:DUF3108 domain-containing protein n=1 Tax=candidate division WOR-3 bacterium TaxID=2052148 RepID=A0A7C4TCG2_UNCW3
MNIVLISVLLLCSVHRIPAQEFILYETYDNGKIGEIKILLNRNENGYNITYSSDRFIEVILDTLNFQTLYLNKMIKGKWEVTLKKNGNIFEVNYKGNKKIYSEKDPVFDRHTLDFALRGFEYDISFKKRIRLHIPEFMIVNADLMVLGEETVSTPIGEIECWKIGMNPRIIFIDKKFYFWIEKEHPYRFVQYRDSSDKNRIIIKDYKSID